MQKIGVTLPVKAWGSTNTKYRPSSINVGDDELTAGSVGFETTPHGTLTKSLGGVPFSKTAFTQPIQDQYEAVFTSGVRHMLVVSNGVLSYTAGDGTFAAVNSGYNATAHFEFAGYKDRVYGGNGLSTLVYDRTPAYGGSTPVAVPHVMTPGCTAPSTAPSAANGSAGNVPVGSYFYKVTFLYYGEEESNGGPASTIVTVTSSAKQINLTAIPVGDYGVSAREIYRSDDGIVYRHVGEIADATTTTFTDNKASGDEQIPLDNGTPPAFSLILNHRDRNWMAGVSGQDFVLYYSEAGFPDIVASDDFIRCNPKDPIVALIVYNDQILVFNRRSMGQIVGDTPDTFAYQEIPSSVGCVDNRSIQLRTVAATETNTWVSGGVPSVIWLSEKGVYEYNGSAIRYHSDKIEDILNVNIQQVQQSKGQNAQSGTDFNAGTASGGIVLTGGSITTKNPTRIWETEADWTGGSSLSNCAALQTQNVLETPLAFSPAYDTTNTDQLFTDSATVTTSPTNVPGAVTTLGLAGTGTTDYSTGTDFHIEQLYTVPVSGNLTSITVQMNDSLAHTHAHYNLQVSANSYSAGPLLFTAPNVDTSHAGVVAYTPALGSPIPFLAGDVISIRINSTSAPGNTDQAAVRYAALSGASFLVNGSTTVPDSSICATLDIQTADVSIPTGALTLTGFADNTGESHLTGPASNLIYFGTVYDTHNHPITENVQGAQCAFGFIPPRSGTIGDITFKFQSNVAVHSSFTLNFYSDSFAGLPGALITSVTQTSTLGGVQTLTFTVNQYLTGGSRYWAGLVVTPDAINLSARVVVLAAQSGAFSAGAAQDTLTQYHNTVSPVIISASPWRTSPAPIAAYTFTQDVVATSGSWVSEVYDSHLTGSAGVALAYAQVGLNPSQATTTVSVAQSDDVDFTTPEILTISNPNGSYPLSLTTTKRYWQVEIDMATTDDRDVPVFGQLTLSPPTTTVWESEAIDCTSDVTAYSALTPTQTVHGSGTFAVLAASSADGSSYSSWDTLANTAVDRYIKFQITLANPTNTAADLSSVTALEFDYEIVANLVSSIINCGVVPAGWDVFQGGYLANGGTITWYLRSAASSGAISAASYVAVTPGDFPATTPNQYAQWKVVVDSTVNKVPVVSTVTLKWFIGGITTVRAASLFYNRNYYLAVAELGQPANNLVIEYDWAGNWRIRKDISASTMGFYYSDPYYGSVSPLSIVRWLYGPTNFDGSSIPMDMRTKAFDFGTNIHPKILRKLFVTLGQTGATWTFTYSLDGGRTFLPLYDSAGNTTVSTSAIDGSIPIVARLVPAGGDLAGAKTIMFRAFTNDAFTAELHEMAVGAMIRQGDILRG